MDGAELKKFREKLISRKDAIFATVEHLEEANQKMTEEITERRHLDWLDQAWDENEIRLLDRLNDTYRSEVEKINIALQRIGSGSYGLCLACHQLIENGRLEAYPETEFCLECQDTREKFEKGL